MLSSFINLLNAAEFGNFEKFFAEIKFMMGKKRLISIDLTIASFDEQVKSILAFAQNKISSYVCVANVHMLVEAYKDEDFAQVVNDADLVTTDGMPLSKSLKLLYGIHQERVAGVDIILNLLKESEKDGISIGFYGGTQEIQDRTKAFIQKEFPDLNVTLYKPHPFRELSRDEEVFLAAEFNELQTQILFVATGCPRQERWMASQKGTIQAVMVGVGGALTVVNGMKKNAPEWMRKNSLEWLYRLSLEPKRLFKRYAVTNTTFLYLLSKELLTKKNNSAK